MPGAGDPDPAGILIQFGPASPGGAGLSAFPLDSIMEYASNYGPRHAGKLVVCQPSLANAGTKQYQTTEAIGGRFIITGMIVVCDKQDPDIWVRFGASRSPVTDDTTRADSLSPFLSAGRTSQTDINDGISMAVGGIGITDVNMEINDPLMRLFVQVDNRSVTNAARVFVVFKVTLLPESE